MLSKKKIKEISYLLTFLVCFVVSFLFVFSVFLNTLEVNPVKLNIDLDNKIFTFVPQGWAFFTRNPREAQIVLYQKNKNNELIEIPQRHSSCNNLFGLNRKASKLMSELQFIKSKVDVNLYYNTRWNYQENIYSQIPNKMVIIKNQMADPILIGEYVVVFQKAVPWAWTKSIHDIKMPAKIIRLKIEPYVRTN